MKANGAPGIDLKRAYERTSRADGRRFLVERLWPRGVAKDALAVEGWMKDVAPSTDLRKWFGHDPARWSEFRRRYFRELRARPSAWRPLADAAVCERITLVYSSHDEEHNAAVALKEFLEDRLVPRRDRTTSLPAARPRRPGSRPTK